MLERQGHSQTEIEAKVASFRALLLRQVNSINNNTEPRDNSGNSGNHGNSSNHGGWEVEQSEEPGSRGVTVPRT